MKKNFRLKKEIFLIFILFLFYIFSRLIRINLIPIFTDEAIYIRWAEIARYDAAWRFISLSDGKQPLFVWLVMVILPFFKDPLIAGRLVSVVAGLITMVGLFLLGWELFGKKEIGFLAALLYLLYPFALVYDRMALMDGLVGSFAIWSLYFQVLLVKKLRLDLALILGMLIGGGMLTKSSGFFNLYLLPFSLLLFPWGKPGWKKKLLLWFGLASLAAVESQVIYSILRLSPLFHMISEKNSVFVYHFKEWIIHPWQFFKGNLKGLWDWFIGYFSWPIFIVSLWGLIINFKKKWSHGALLLIWFAAPFLALALFGRVLYPRFIFFMTLSLLLLSALGINYFFNYLKKLYWIIGCCLILFFWWIKTDYQLLTNPYLANIPDADRIQYLNDWPAGGGIKEVVEFLNKESEKGKIYVATEGTFGPLPYALEVYLYKNHNVEIRGFWPLKEEMPKEVLEAAKTKPTYFVFNQTQQAPPGWPLKLIAKYQKGIGSVYLHLYQVMNE